MMANVLVQGRAACRRVPWNGGLGVTPEFVTPEKVISRGAGVNEIAVGLYDMAKELSNRKPLNNTAILKEAILGEPRVEVK